jgi:NAD(P)-dependent dehydrogenase (short-subunit alcohol dehydrogenase family)
MEMKGRVALITGGGSGIGRALALALAEEGASVVIADILADNAQRVADEIKKAGGAAAAIGCDVSDRASVGRLKSEAKAAFGRSVSLLFANAGATSFEKLTDMSENDVDWIIQANLMGVTNCLMAFYPDMMAAGEGHLVATASTAGLLPAWVPYHAPYSAAKMGIIGMMLNLRIEAAEFGVGCTVLVPHGVQSGMKANNSRNRPERFGGPGTGEVKLPERFRDHATIRFRPAQDVAQMVLRAVRANRAMVTTDATLRSVFVDNYVKVVMEAFDDVDDYELKPAREAR